LLFLAQNAPETAWRPDPLGELKRSPDPLAAVKGLEPPGRGRGKGKGREGGEGRRERREGWRGRGIEGGIHNLRKTTPPSSDGWIRA